MSWEGELLRIDENRVEIPIGTVPGMKTNAIIYADKTERFAEVAGIEAKKVQEQMAEQLNK